MIRVAEKDDIKKIIELALKLWPNYKPEEVAVDTETAIDRDDMTVLVAEEDGELLGFARVSLNRKIRDGIKKENESYLDGFYVKESERFRGIGTELLNACMEWAKEKGKNELVSYSDIRNVESVNFHMKSNFKEQTRIVKFSKKF